MELKPDREGLYELVIRLRSSQPFIDIGDVYTIDGRPGVRFTCGLRGATRELPLSEIPAK